MWTAAYQRPYVLVTFRGLIAYAEINNSKYLNSLGVFLPFSRQSLWPSANSSKYHATSTPL